MLENKSAGNEPKKVPSESVTPQSGSEAVTLTKSQAINLCATGLFICFFLPWAQLLGQSVSGYDLQKIGGNQKLLWLIPISCGITIVASYLKEGQKAAAQFAGALPFLALIYWIHEFGIDAIKNILAFGAYAGLALAAVLTILSAKSK